MYFRQTPSSKSTTTSMPQMGGDKRRRMRDRISRRKREKDRRRKDKTRKRRTRRYTHTEKW